MTTQEIKTALRKELNNKGFKGQFSISAKTYGDAYVTVKANESIENKALFNKICMKFQEVDRCEITHEILQGGNTFVTVSFDGYRYSIWDLCKMQGVQGDIYSYYDSL